MLLQLGMLSLLGNIYKASKLSLQSRIQVQYRQQLWQACDPSETVLVQSSLLLYTLETRCFAMRHEQQTLSWQSHSVALAESMTMQTGHIASQQGSRPGSGLNSYNPKAGLPKDSSTWGTKPGSDKDFVIQPYQVANRSAYTEAYLDHCTCR